MKRNTSGITQHAFAPYAIRYRYIFQLGGNEHSVELYEDYSEADGLVGNSVSEYRSPRIADCLKSLTPEQKKRVKALAKCREDGIVLKSGEFRSR